MNTSPPREIKSALPGVRLLIARNVSFPAPLRIVRAEYAIKLTTKGCGAPLVYRGESHAACSAGGVSLFRPYETSRSQACDEVTSFASLLVDPEAVAGKRLRPFGSEAVHVNDAALAWEIKGLADDLLAGEPGAAIEQRFVCVVDALFTDGAEHDAFAAGDAAVRRVRELILDRLRENVPLAEIEREIGMSRFHMSRLFRKRYGLSPHAFRTHARIAAARKLIARGLPLVDVAADTGFCDQSQMHRHFRRLTGISPGQYRHGLRRR